MGATNQKISFHNNIANSNVTGDCSPKRGAVAYFNITANPVKQAASEVRKKCETYWLAAAIAISAPVFQP